MGKYQHNRQFFDQFTPESCYWAGFIAADGNIYPPNGGIIFGLSERDKDHLVKLARSISADNPVRCRDTSNGYRAAWLQIYGAHECHKALEEQFNITSRKSLSLIPPPLTREDNIRHFIRGYMDGDGSISKTGKNNHWQISFIGTKQMLEWIKTQFQNYITNIGNPSVLPDRRVFQIVFQCKQTKSILDWLYCGSTEATRLDRKYKRYGLVCERYKHF